MSHVSQEVLRSQRLLCLLCLLCREVPVLGRPNAQIEGISRFYEGGYGGFWLLAFFYLKDIWLAMYLQAFCLLHTLFRSFVVVWKNMAFLLGVWIRLSAPHPNWGASHQWLYRPSRSWWYGSVRPARRGMVVAMWWSLLMAASHIYPDGCESPKCDKWYIYIYKWLKNVYKCGDCFGQSFLAHFTSGSDFRRRVATQSVTMPGQRRHMSPAICFCWVAANFPQNISKPSIFDVSWCVIGFDW